MRRRLRAICPFLLALFVILSMQVLAPGDISAQQEMEDVVELKDGSVLRGMIVEDVPGESLLIETRDGNRFRISYDRIAQKTREPRTGITTPAPTQTETPAQPRAQVTDGRKSPGLAFLLSFLLVGAGQGYNGQWGKTAVMAGGALISVGIASSAQEKCDLYDECGKFAAGVLGAVGFVLWSWIDAPISASAINTRIDMGVALELGPRTTLGFPSDELAGHLSRGQSLPQVGVSLARLRF